MNYFDSLRFFGQGLLLFTLVIAGQSEQNANSDNSMGTVSNAFRVRLLFPNTVRSFEVKALARLGDQSARCLTKLVKEQDWNNPQTTNAALSIILDSFAAPQLIEWSRDREPVATRHLLSEMKKRAKSPELESAIEATGHAITETLSKPPVPPTGSEDRQ